MALTEHIADEIFDRYAARAATPAENLRVQTHVVVCEVCRQKMARTISAEKAFAVVHNNFAFDELADAPEHLQYEQLESFIDNKLDAVDREIAESHLTVCAECKKDLTDLQRYREVAAAPQMTGSTAAGKPKQSFWSKIFAFGAIGTLAPVAAIALLAILLGAWFLLRGNRSEEIARDNNQNILRSNLSSANNLSVVNASPETKSPETAPSPAENLPNNETLYALNDGRLTIDNKGNIRGTENLSLAAQNAIKQSLQLGKLAVVNHSLGGGGGVLMGGGGDPGNGVPFGLETPIGKVIKENRPLLRWKPLKDATGYSAAIVDDQFRVVEQSGKLTTTGWQPSKPLPRGANYSWQVTATLTDGTETVSPSSPAPQARFRVVEQNLFDDINKLETSGARPSNLALGVLYAKAGMKREARAAFGKLVRENPNSDVARKLLQSVK